MSDTIANKSIVSNDFKPGRVTAAQHATILMFVAGWLTCAPQLVLADLVKLKGGGELRGVFLDPIRSGKAPNAPIRMTTLTGGVVTVDSADVELVAKRSRQIEEYEWKARLAPATAAGHWELQDWCRQNSLKREREIQLAAVIVLDPNHGDAHRLLGHVKENGKWMTRDEAMALKGYVKYKGKYLFPQEVELLETSAAQRQSAGSWNKKLHVIREALHGGSLERRLEALKELEELSDSDAVGPLINLFRNEPVDEVRLVFVKTLGRLGGGVAVQALVLQSLFDSCPSVRLAAMESIPRKERGQAIPIYLKGLKDELNEVVVRSAVGLGFFGDADVVPALIEALVTVHSYTVKVQETGYLAQGSYPAELSTPVVVNRPVDIPLSIPGLPGAYSSANPGSLYNPGNLGVTTQQVVQMPPQVTRERIQVTTHPHQNVEVLAALRKLTKEDFGYDQRTWRIWWISRSGK
ncbi:MAG: lyase domain protein repeat-containing protein [Planctomycetaceae bacterium]|nr:lyase domain protein repeat-containing protein [Planctomycetaceae bacterium]